MLQRIILATKCIHLHQKTKIMHQLLFRIGEYLRHKLKSRGIQYIHSPFLFQLMKTCFYDQPEDMFLPIEKIRHELLLDTQKIKRTDMGAGNSEKKNLQPVGAIARKSLQPPRNARLLFRLAKYMQAKNILELGTSFGITTSYLAMASENGNVITIEGDPAIHDKAVSHFNQLGLTNIHAVCGNFDDVLPQLISTHGSFDMVWIDGNHRKEPTLRYYEMLLPYLHPEGLMIFDDIHWSPEMAEAWDIIRKDEKATLSVDIFQMGLVFISKKLSKEHRIIRYPL